MNTCLKSHFVKHAWATIKNNKLFMASYSESELHSNFAVNSSKSESGSDSESNSSSVYESRHLYFLYFILTLF